MTRTFDAARVSVEQNEPGGNFFTFFFENRSYGLRYEIISCSVKNMFYNTRERARNTYSDHEKFANWVGDSTIGSIVGTAVLYSCKKCFVGEKLQNILSTTVHSSK